MVAFNIYIKIQEPLYEQLMGANPRLFALLQRNYGWDCPMVGGIVQVVKTRNYYWRAGRTTAQASTKEL